MAQFARPSADTVRESWDEDDGTTDALWGRIDEVSASDADYIRSQLAPGGDAYVTALTNVTDPVSSAGHVIRYRYAKSAAAGAQQNLTAELRQGYVSEVSLGTLIKTLGTHVDISETITQNNVTLSAGEADSITDYTSLFLRFVATQV